MATDDINQLLQVIIVNESDGEIENRNSEEIEAKVFNCHVKPEIVDGNSNSVDQIVEVSNNLETAENEIKKKKKPHRRNDCKIKRQRNEANWMCNKRKLLRNSGKTYVNSRGKTVPGKEFTLIKKCCVNNCYKQFSPTAQEMLFSKFYDNGNFNDQNAYICSQVKSLPINRRKSVPVLDGELGKGKAKSNTKQYYLEDEDGIDKKVCKGFFKTILHISDGRLHRVLRKKDKLTPPVDNRGRHTPHNKTADEIEEELFTFIQSFPSYDSRENSGSKKYLAPGINMRLMYQQFRSKSSQQVTESKFRQVFKSKFNLQFHPPNTELCKKCDFLNMEITCETDAGRKEELKVELEDHKFRANVVREEMNKSSKIIVEGDDTTVISFDLMKTLPTPHLSSGVTNYKRQLWTYCVGFHNMRTGEATMFVWDESVASRGPQEIGSCLLYFCKHFVNTKRLILYSDGCGGQNRNLTLAIFCTYVVLSPEYSITQLQHNFLVNGHAFLPCHLDFEEIKKNKNFYQDIFTPAHWIDVILTARKKHPFNVIAMKTTDFVSTVAFEQFVSPEMIQQATAEIEWSKIVYLYYNEIDPFVFKFKYDSSKLVQMFVDLGRTKWEQCGYFLPPLPLLFPDGHVISEEKKSELLLLKEFLPQVYHHFYTSLQCSPEVIDLISLPRNIDESI